MASDDLGLVRRSTPLTRPPDTPPDARTGPVLHVSLLWLKERGHAEHTAAFCKAAHKLESIPGVSWLKIGPPSIVTWSDPDQSWDFALVIYFESRAAMDAYQTHPAHLEAIALSHQIVDRFHVCYIDDLQ